MKKCIAICLLIILICPAFAQKVCRIIPGKSVGHAFLGSDIRTYTAWGEPEIDFSEDGVHYSYDQYGIDMVTDQGSNRVRAIIVYSESGIYKTDKGIKMGSSLNNVLRAYGNDYIVKHEGKLLMYLYLGIAFGFENNKVTMIFVFDPSTK